MTKKPRIKICHLLLDPKTPKDVPASKWESTIGKQSTSISYFNQLASGLHAYTQQYSDVNRSELPVATCAQPDIINHSTEFDNNPPVLSYGHYGAYMAHRRGATEEFGEHLDALIIVEGDVVSDLDPEALLAFINNAYEFGVAQGAGLITFDKLVMNSGEGNWDLVRDLGDWWSIPHFLLGSMYMILASERTNIAHKYATSGWHSPDIWLSWNFHARCTILAPKTPVVRQLDGVSMIDYLEKEENNIMHVSGRPQI